MEGALDSSRTSWLSTDNNKIEIDWRQSSMAQQQSQTIKIIFVVIALRHWRIAFMIDQHLIQNLGNKFSFS